SDIPIIAEQFCEEICTDYGMPIKKITSSAIDALKSLPWTGNIRELRNMVERLIILSDKSITDKDVYAYANPGGPVLESAEVTTSICNGATICSAETNHLGSINGLNHYDQFSSFQEYKDDVEREDIKYKLENNAWKVSKTADDIEIQRSHLYSKIEK